MSTDIQLQLTDLKNALYLVMSGVSNNKFLPLTSLIQIDITKERLTLSTFDGENSVKFSYSLGNNPTIPNDYNKTITVDATMLNTVIPCLNTKTITINIDDTKLKIEAGDNSYIIYGVVEGSSPVLLPKIEEDSFYDLKPLRPKDFIDIRKVNASIAYKDKQVDYLTKCYFDGNYAVSTDGFNACFTGCKAFAKEMLLDFSLLKLMSLFENLDEILYGIRDNKIMFLDKIECSTLAVVGNIYDSKDYPIGQLLNLLDKDLSIKVLVDKKDFLTSLTRMKPFLDLADVGTIILAEEDGRIVLSNMNKTIRECPITTSINQVKEDYSCKVDLKGLELLVKTNISDTVELYLGSDTIIKCIDNNILKIMSLSE